MTPAEHDLLIAFFARQQQLIKTILEVLKNKHLVTDDDLAAFGFAVTGDVPSNAALLAGTKAEYLDLAKVLGVHTGLGNS